ncbi:hypothetical protein MKZ38_001829 [Zalerion maritima]|uniref:Spray n=1 Tax=Zalerion maritima TaxID=339359 RepID=A0AAD5WSW8_9PEZI|nr:hypothetical protein MKZ38_001829 [Zalerion maritima]
MDSYQYPGHQGWQQQQQQKQPVPQSISAPPPAAGPQIFQHLQHRASTVSNIPETEYHSLQPRESMVSINTEFCRTPQPQHSFQQPQYPAGDDGDNSYYGQSGWAVPFLGRSNQGYEPVSAMGGNAGGMGGTGDLGSNTQFMGGRGGSMSRKKSRMQSMRDQQHQTIPEDESIDLALLSSAAPMGYENNFGPAAPNHNAALDDDDMGPGIDLSSFGTGPPMGHAPPDAMLPKFQVAEASGQLTGGIGAGWRPEATVRGEDLLAMSPASDRTPTGLGIGRSFTRRMPKLGRKDTLRALGQSEANRRGKIVEVLVDDEEEVATLPAAAPSDVDLSVMTGPSTLDNGGHRASTYAPAKKTKTETFYPEPNWKPFSMRWPYLTFLIFLSIGLAVAQEMAYQNSPLFDFTSPDEVPPSTYFAVKFLPTIITVAYGVLWQFTDFEVRRLEAFYQLSKPGGALAAESINVDYITALSFFRPFRALKLKHYAVAISSVATVMSISLVPTLGAASIYLTPNREERNKNPEDSKFIMVDPTWSRLLSVVFCLCALMAMSLFWLFHRRKTGLNNDVKGIAGLASMAVVSHILMDFKDLDVAPPKDIHARLKYHRYVLRNSSLAPDDENLVSRQDQEKYDRTHLSDNPHPAMLRPSGAIPFIIWIVAFLVFIPIFLFTPADIVTNNAPWVVTLMAISIKLCWGSLDTDVRMIEPYYVLYNRHAPPKTLCLDYTALPFGWMPIRALLNGHWLVFLVGFGTVMAEMLTILATSLATVDGHAFLDNIKEAKDGAFGDDHDDHDKRMVGGFGLFGRDDDDDVHDIDAGQETVGSFFACVALVGFILIYMAIVATVVYIRRRHPFLPRLPNTIASILAFIHQSKMIYDFPGTEKLNNDRMTRKLESIGKKYGLGWFEGRDGQTHCGVDEEELSGNYRHGMNYESINKPWVGNWDRWEE